MALHPIQLLMVVVIALSGVIGHAVRASMSCCGGTHTAMVVMTTSPDAGATIPQGCCGGCSADQDMSVSTGNEDAPKRCPIDGPCDGDCQCTLCGAITAMTGAVLPAAAPGLFHSSQTLPVPAEQTVCARDQRFDLLRPPQC